MGTKAALRRTAEERRRRSAAQSDLGPLLAPLLRRSAQIAGYLPWRGEPFVTPEPRWLLPVVLPNGDLDWAVSTGEDVPGLRGTREPTGPRLGVDAISRCDLVLVPALLVDHQGYRLGRGGGSYDRALARATGLTVALLHDGELVGEVPHEAHDIPVRAVVMPSTGVVMLPLTDQGE
jgi:5-formyltetrahydrofolate cyclo-ligase